MSLLFGFVAIVLQADFIVAGLGLNILAAGGTLFALEEFYQDPGGLRPDSFPDIWHVPEGALDMGRRLSGRLSSGRASSFSSPSRWPPLCAFVLYRTPMGYALRAVGEDEQAASAVGIHVATDEAIRGAGERFARRSRRRAIVDGPAALLSAGHDGGRGFIGLAATLFGGGLPWATTAAAFLFGFFGALGDRLQLFRPPLNSC